VIWGLARLSLQRQGVSKSTPRRERLAKTIRHRLPHWSKPRLGQVGPHYSPRPLVVPRDYLDDTVPDPPPTISIVTPVLNCARFVRWTIESVLGQDYPALEYIVMDGGSEDGSLETVKRYDSQLVQIELPTDFGQGSAINAGFARANGEIMAWINADDLILPGTLAFVARYFADHPEIDMIYGDRILIDEENRDIGRWVTPKHCDEAVVWFDYLPQETVFWRRRLWEELGPLDESYDLAFDWDLFLRFHSSGARIERVPRYLGAFRHHPVQRSWVHHEVTLEEVVEIRERRMGRDVSLEEALAGIQWYRLRSVPRYVRHRASAQWRRNHVSAVPEIRD
jgi:glycosyltransferase involved in cell wall biosynthesis